MNYKVKLALTMDNKEFFKTDDVAKVTLEDDRVFIGRIIKVDYKSFTIDCAIDYVSNETVILNSQVKTIERIEPVTSFKVKTVDYIR